MGRRSLPKIDRSISVADHFSELTEMEPPFSVAEFFGESDPQLTSNNRQFEIEIGSGKGLFLLNASGENPDRLYLGVELSKKYSNFASFRFARQQRTNVRMINGDAMRFMSEFAQNQTADAIHVYFPDPWWKERHRRRRIVNPQVVADIQRVLKPGGVFHFWTDVEEYFESAIQIINDNSDLDGPREVAEKAATHDMDYRTHFERRMRLNDHPVFRSQFHKD